MSRDIPVRPKDVALPWQSSMTGCWLGDHMRFTSLRRIGIHIFKPTTMQVERRDTYSVVAIPACHQISVNSRQINSRRSVQQCKWDVNHHSHASKRCQSRGPSDMRDQQILMMKHWLIVQLENEWCILVGSSQCRIWMSTAPATTTIQTDSYLNRASIV